MDGTYHFSSSGKGFILPTPRGTSSVPNSARNMPTNPTFASPSPGLIPNNPTPRQAAAAAAAAPSFQLPPVVNGVFNSNGSLAVGTVGGIAFNGPNSTPSLLQLTSNNPGSNNTFAAMSPPTGAHNNTIMLSANAMANANSNQPPPNLASAQNVYSFVQTCAYKGSQGRLYTRPGGVFFNSAAHSFQIAWRSIERISSSTQNYGGQLLPTVSIKVRRERAAQAEAFAYMECNAYRHYCRRESQAVGDVVVDHMRRLGGAAAHQQQQQQGGAAGGAATASANGGGAVSSFGMNSITTNATQSTSATPTAAGGAFMSPQDCPPTAAYGGGADGLLSQSQLCAVDGIEAMADFLRKEVAANTAINNKINPNKRNIDSYSPNNGTTNSGGGLLNGTVKSPGAGNGEDLDGLNDTPVLAATVNAGTKANPDGSSDGPSSPSTAGHTHSTSSNQTDQQNPPAATANNNNTTMSNAAAILAAAAAQQPQQILPITYSRSVTGASLISPLSTLASLVATDDRDLASNGTYTFTIQAYTGDVQTIGSRLKEQMADHFKELCLLAVEQRRYDLIGIMKGAAAASIVESAAALQLEFNRRCAQKPPRDLGEYFSRMVDASKSVYVHRSREAGGGSNGLGVGGAPNSSRSMWGPRLHNQAPEVIRRVDEAIMHCLNHAASKQPSGQFPQQSNFLNHNLQNSSMLNSTVTSGGCGAVTSSGGGPLTNMSFRPSSLGQPPGSTVMSGGHPSLMLSPHGTAVQGGVMSETGSACGQPRICDIAKGFIEKQKQEQSKLDPDNFPLLYQTKGAPVTAPPKPPPAEKGDEGAASTDVTSLTGLDQQPSPTRSTNSRNGRVAFSEKNTPASSPTGGGAGGFGGAGAGGMLSVVTGPLMGAFTVVDDAVVKPVAVQLGKRLIPKALITSKRARIRFARHALLAAMALCSVYCTVSVVHGIGGVLFPPPTAEALRAQLKHQQLLATEKAVAEFMFGGSTAANGGGAVGDEEGARLIALLFDANKDAVLHAGGEGAAGLQSINTGGGDALHPIGGGILPKHLVAEEALLMSQNFHLSKEELAATINRVALAKMSANLIGGGGVGGAAADGQGLTAAAAPAFAAAEAMLAAPGGALYNGRRSAAHQVSWFNFTNFLVIITILVAVMTIASKFFL